MEKRTLVVITSWHTEYHWDNTEIHLILLDYETVSCVSSPAGFIKVEKNPGQWNRCHGWTEHFFENSSNSDMPFSDTLKFRKKKLKVICSPACVIKIHWKLFCSFMISITCIFQDEYNLVLCNLFDFSSHMIILALLFLISNYVQMEKGSI